MQKTGNKEKSKARERKVDGETKGKTHNPNAHYRGNILSVKNATSTLRVNEMWKFKEATTGLEPVNDGFAIRCLSHLARSPSINTLIVPYFFLLTRANF